MRTYILNGHVPVEETDYLKFAQWHDTSPDRQVGNDQIGDVRVSTVFLGFDAGLGYGKPLLFETMVLGRSSIRYQKRYATWEEAEAGHRTTVELVKYETRS